MNGKWENYDEFRELCIIMGSRSGWLPQLFVHPLMVALTGRIMICPSKVEQYIFDSFGESAKEGESIKSLVIRIYGEKAAKLMEKLF